jgi:hypothetical protein
MRRRCQVHPHQIVIIRKRGRPAQPVTVEKARALLCRQVHEAGYVNEPTSGGRTEI